MKFRPYAATVAAFATAAISLTVIAPAQAAPTDPVTNLAVSQSQVGQEWVVNASWTANDTATTYKVLITDDEAATSVVKSKDFAANAGAPATADLATADLVSGGEYWLAVRAKSGETLGAVESVPFTAITLDSTGPTGTYTVNRTSAFMTIDFDAQSFDEIEAAAFTVTQTSLSDNTPGGSITRTIQAGDGSPPTTWTKPTYKLKYHRPGTFTPKVRLTDQFGNVTTVNLPALTVKRDVTNPRVRITTPANPTKVASWRRIKGTATDAETGVSGAMAFVVQKRGGVWYAYDFHKRKWLKGYSGLTKTLRKSKARPASMRVNAAGAWQTPAIRGLRKGKLHVEAAAFDNGFNLGEAPKVNRTLR
ncbi:PKD domain-containing protein [Nocardioides marmoriginsengisoli]|uniref:PKD domain-containing protein n=1 Tax=Nocardioides marmoriginsengisoli TaxID=661483 RepID=A0A3N0CRV3_9ACTN|nr:PKD domain-containing protein [Nocardioides marmoriginsengisoli]RNL66204.1 PKD domain-containing protein [Nocardioides marmoriginsengisoli]